MYNFDLRPLFYLAILGLISAVIIIVGGGGWVLYHLVSALIMYMG